MFYAFLPFSILLIALTLQLCFRKVRDRFLRHTLIFLFIAMLIRISLLGINLFYILIIANQRQLQGKIISDYDWYNIKRMINFWSYELPF